MNSTPTSILTLLGFLFLSVFTSSAAVVTATYSSATTVPVSAATYTATGNTVNFTLNYAPEAGTTLTVVRNTGMSLIVGTFDNLAQGQIVNMTRSGITYPFVANYFGGTGNDLVLQWANTRLVGFGTNSNGQLGNNITASSRLPIPTDLTGVLAGRTITNISAGEGHALALCADGTLASWGTNTFAQLGNNTRNDSSLPVLVQQPGALATKRVIAIAAGATHNLALYSDNTLVAWGDNTYGQLGTGNTSLALVPVLVSRTGSFATKTIVAISAGGNHSLVLCSDGTLVSWGFNTSGQLGNGSTAQSTVPVFVTQTGVLATRTVIAISSGGDFSLVHCSDGNLASWGNGVNGRLGNNALTSSSVPVLVNRASGSALSGRTVTAISAGNSYSLALCSDGNIAGWGSNSSGPLGTGGQFTNNQNPVLVSRAGVLSSKIVAGIATATAHSLARNTDGSLASWGFNGFGQLGDYSTTNSLVPVLVDSSGMKPGERFIETEGGFNFSLGLIASPIAPQATTLAATALRDTSVTLNASVNAAGSSTAISFEYGTTSAYGSSVAGVPATLTGSTNTAATANLGNLLSGTTYQYRVIASSAGGTVKGTNMTFTTTNFTSLSGLNLGSGTLSPDFSNNVTSYFTTVPNAVSTITVTPQAEIGTTTVRVNGVIVASGAASNPLALAEGNNVINIVVTSADSINTRTYTVTATRLPLTFTFNSASSVPVTAADFVATGNTATLALGYTPTPGTNLTVVNNNGNNLIRGSFDNLAQDQLIQLTFGGISYAFLVDYFGGTGNDLVLRWANNRMLGWGENFRGQLGNGTTSIGLIPAPSGGLGILAGKTIQSVASGGEFSIALCTDGTMAAWGQGQSGQFGNDGTATSSVPVAVNQTGILAGKRVVAVDVGDVHVLALCSDGSLASWGGNDNGQLGKGSTGTSNLRPEWVDQTGVLAGKKIIAVAAGSFHSLALCSDGTVAAWGANLNGELGTKTPMIVSSVPVLVDRAGGLVGRTVTSLAAGSQFSIALCSDGNVAAWGNNGNGQLGNNTVISSTTPVLVNRSAVLTGETIVEISAGWRSCLARCQSGSLVTWGSNASGQLGNNSLISSSVPVKVLNTSGPLLTRTPIAVANGGEFAMALCSDGALVSWGINGNAQLGNNTQTNSQTPVLVTMTAVLSGQRTIAAIASGGNHSIVTVASPPPPLATTIAASGILDNAVTLNGSVNAQGTSTAVSFEYGLTTAYGTVVTGSPSAVTGAATTNISATVSGLLSGATYHYRTIAASGGGTVRGDNMTFTTSSLAGLFSLTPSFGTLTPAIALNTTNYLLTVPFSVSSISLTPVVLHPGATVKVNNVSVVSGNPSGALSLNSGTNSISVAVTSADGIITRNFTVTVTRLPEIYTFVNATTAPVTVGDFVATGQTAVFALNFAPVVGTTLTVVKNTGINLIQGTFDNLAQGQRVELTFNGLTYAFVANYYGGSGNDLVLQWANTRAIGWGSNSSFNLGINTASNASVLAPTPVDQTGVLANKTVVAVATGASHSVFLCADGTLATAGGDDSGQLGNGSASATQRPGLVDRAGILANKTVVAIAAGSSHTLALCADGTLAAWGNNAFGQLGTNNLINSTSPIAVNIAGVLAGKTVVAIAAGGTNSMVLCSDGTVATWGRNNSGQLGNNSTINSSVPVAVLHSGLLSGKKVIAIAAGLEHMLAVCDDNTVAAWGSNGSGRLGNNSTTNSSVPVAVDRTGVLSTKIPVSVAAGQDHSSVLCEDGTLAAWGSNAGVQLGVGSTTPSFSSVPVLASGRGVLSTRTATRITAGSLYSLATCSDGSAAAWGSNSSGQLGTGNTTFATSAVAISAANLAAGERIIFVASGPSSSSSLGISALPLPPIATTLAATSVLDASATLNSSINAQGVTTAVSFEYGLTSNYGTTVASSPASVSGSSNTATSALVSGLLSGTTYHYRVIATSAGGTVRGVNRTFTTSTFADLSSLNLSAGTLDPTFVGSNISYIATVPFATSSITLTPVCVDLTSVVRVNGSVVASAAASAPVNLAVGNNPVTVVVTSAGGLNVKTYTVSVYRMPQTLTFNSSTEVPITAANFTAAGVSATIALAHPPLTGTALMVVQNTGTAPIRGAFDNLVQGQMLNLTHAGITYPFVVNYFGGNGNDLVLEWGNNRIVSWGYNDNGQLGHSGTANTLLPTPLTAPGLLAGKAIKEVASAGSFSLALCWDGTLAAWGDNQYGKLGNNSSVDSADPVAVNTAGVLLNKKVVAIAAGDFHSMALCADGTLVTWGYNGWGQLGNDTRTDSAVPVLVSRAGVLANKTITKIAVGYGTSMVLCSDGTFAQWGRDMTGGQLSLSFSVPQAISGTGALANKRVIDFATSGANGLALCSDGTLATWGGNGGGALGTGSSSPSSTTLPVAVLNNAVLAGKTITSLSVGGGHCMVLFSNGDMAGWGYNTNGQIGNNTTTDSYAPVAVIRSGALVGQTVSSLIAGNSFTTALLANGSRVAWGSNIYGQLGNNSTTNSTVPVLVNTSRLRAGERFVTGADRNPATNHTLAIVASPPPPVVATLAATNANDFSATLNAAVQPNGTATSVIFEYGATVAYGNSVAGSPSSVTGSGVFSSSFVVEGLLPSRTYHFRAITSNAGGTVIGENMTFTTTAAATLADLVPSSGALSPVFSSATTRYTITVPHTTTSISLTPTVANVGSTVRVDQIAVDSGTASGPINLASGNTVIPVVVTAAGGAFSYSYTVTVTRVPEVFAFDTAATLPLTVESFLASGNNAAFTLGFAPVNGTDLTVIKNTGLGFIGGTFDNLTQGQMVSLEYNGITYQFVANYYGGSGNDLVLQWANTRLLSWGLNSVGQLGNKSQINRYAPGAVDHSGVLAGKTVISTVCGYQHNIALLSDGTLAAWGLNDYGQVGDNTRVSRSMPVAVEMQGALVGKTAVAVAAGSYHNLVLYSDGTLAGWGNNVNGQLGNIGATRSLVPVVMQDLGVLTGKKIVAIAAGSGHSLALTDDGMLAAWGSNPNGQFGNGGIVSSQVPVLVGVGSVLENKKVMAVSAGSLHNLALCTDGTVVAWGFNSVGQLGDNSKVDRLLPVVINSFGVLAGNQIIAVAAGNGQSHAQFANGALASWGSNNQAQLGNNTQIDSQVPVAVFVSTPLVNKTITRFSVGTLHSLALCSDGTLTAWGYNDDGRLGEGDFTPRIGLSPLAVSTVGLASGERFVGCATGPYGAHSFALAAGPPRASASTLAATAITDTSATLNASIRPNGSSTMVSFEYGLTTAYGSTIAATPSPLTGSGVALASGNVGNLLANTLYHFRVKTVNAGGSSYGSNQTFTTSNFAGLSALAVNSAALSPTFDTKVAAYIATVPFSTTSLTLSAQALHPAATLQINGVALGSGAANVVVNLAVGNNTIPLIVTAEGGIITRTYTVTVMRLPEVFVFRSADEIQVSANAFVAAGNTVSFGLDFAPSPGTNLTVINNTGIDRIQGTFSNLAQGQTVELTYQGIVYPFVASYTAGTGNDLQLLWGNTRFMSWGRNYSGQLGHGSIDDQTMPKPVLTSGVLAGKTIVDYSAGNSHVLAVTADGLIAACGVNSSGQLGNNSTISSSVPLLVDTSGALSGKQVVQVAAGTSHNLALCSDGTLVAWGNNNIGQLGIPTTVTNSLVPVAVNTIGALAGKLVTGIGVGEANSYAICSDGTVVGWGSNSWGQLGNGTNVGGSLPVAVDTSGVLEGKRVVSIDGGTYFCIALCSDGTVASWGYNASGQLGNNTRLDNWVPVAVDRTTVLANKTVTMVSVGPNHVIARCSDNTLASWGYNGSGQLGNPVGNSSAVPVLMDKTGVLANKSVTTLAAAGIYSLGLCSDGTLAIWEYTPTAVDLSPLNAGERFYNIDCGSLSNYGMLASPPRPVVRTLAATTMLSTSATLQGSAGANGSAATISFEYGQTDAYGFTVAAAPSSLNGTTSALVSSAITNLLPGTTYHFRIVASSAGGQSVGENMTFTTNRPPVFATYAFSTPYQTPASISFRKLLGRAVDPDADILTVSAVDAASTRGGTIALQAAAILYTPPAMFAGTDTFTLTVSDGRGGTAVAAVSVTVGPPVGGAGAGSLLTNPPAFTVLPGGKFEIRFRGIPGRVYGIQRSTDMVTWPTIATITAGPTGLLSYIDEAPPQPNAFYRLFIP